MLARFVAVLALLLAFNTYAQESKFYSHKTRGALKGADVVAYYDLQPGDPAIIGTDDITYDWGGVTWHFANEVNRNKFILEPEKYVPQYGGYCAFAVAKGFTAPPRPDSWTIVDGKLYLNNNPTSDKIWQRDRGESIQKGDANWVEISKK
ncbi:YHS domain-containing (seleno)protein [Sessilibacter sp. MAH1]